MFENFISLGYYCGVAAAMSKLGIRSVSGPFDWYISNNFEKVLDCLENDFSNFLKKENIELKYGKTLILDNQYEFCMGHEIKFSFEEEYDSIYQKYMRRIDIFRSQIKQKTCFIRAVYNNDELAYIQYNTSRINSIIKKENKENEIIYILGTEIEGGGNLSAPFYRSNSSYGARIKDELRKLFDSSEELVTFITSNYDENKRYRNKVFDLQKENQMLAYRYGLMVKIDSIVMDKKIPEKMIIYGCGRVGKHFYQRIKEKTDVLYFIDKDPKENFYEGKRVFRYGEKLDYQDKVPVIVTPCYEYNEIRKSLLIEYGEMKIIPMTDLFSR